MEKPGFPTSPQARQIIREQLNGYKVLNELVKKEDRELLPRLTPETSAQIYSGLWEMWELTRKQRPDYKRLDGKRIQYLVSRRKLFDRIGGT